MAGYAKCADPLTVKAAATIQGPYRVRRALSPPVVSIGILYDDAAPPSPSQRHRMILRSAVGARATRPATAPPAQPLRPPAGSQAKSAAPPTSACVRC